MLSSGEFELYCVLVVVAVLVIAGLFELLFARRVALQCRRIDGERLEVLAASLAERSAQPANDNARTFSLAEPPVPAPRDAETQPPTSSGVRCAATGVERPAARRGAA